MAHDVLHVTHLLVPKQEGTSDSCTTTDEEQLFAYQHSHDLLTLGWVHTHPSQTCFMSSLDLHTHCGYQLMLPEAVAIVCAPRHQDEASFQLTTPYGLPYIAQCREPGFHPHPQEPPLYQPCGHVRFTDGASLTIIDMRH
eukprot:Colp12_sorted_trinity150504_noHs@33951